MNKFQLLHDKIAATDKMLMFDTSGINRIHGGKYVTLQVLSFWAEDNSKGEVLKERMLIANAIWKSEGLHI